MQFGIALFCICMNNIASADLAIAFSIDNGVNFVDQVEATAGDQLTIGIYLRETDPVNERLLVDEGIISFGFDLTRSNPGLGTIVDPVVNSEFDFVNHDVTTATGFEWEYGESLGSGIKGANVLLGSFQFDIASPGTSTMTVEDRLLGSGTGNASWYTPSFADIDEQIFGTGASNSFGFTIHAVSAVPEPNSITLFGLLMTGFAVVRRRVRNRRPV